LKPLGKQAVMMGHQPHEKTLRLYAKAAIAVVPSTWNEPLGRTAIEAMAAGCALVTSGHGGLAEIAGDAGVIVDPVTPEGLALALQGLIEDPETLRHIQQMCVTRAPLFSLQSVQHQLDGLRYQLLGQAYGG
jgi:glycosyltransferase involved in cell wall biosynthesis